MKYSQFNSIIAYEGKYVLYNTYYAKLIIFENNLRELLLNNRNSLEYLRKIHPSFYEELVTNNFLIEDNVQEADLVKKISMLADNNQSTYQLTINPTMNCNFNCWYCYETHERASMMKKSVLNNVYKFISRTLKDV